MRIDEALQQIDSIAAIADRTATYRGFRCFPIALTGILGFVAAAIQPWWQSKWANQDAGFLTLWVTVAVISMIVVVSDMLIRYYQDPTARTRRLTLTVMKCLAPSILVGGGLSVVLAQSAPESIWMLPGLWSLLLGLGIYAAAPHLPKELLQVGIWYLGCGFACLILSDDANTSKAWSMAMSMAIPFGVGQLLTAWLIHTNAHQTSPSFSHSDFQSHSELER